MGAASRSNACDGRANTNRSRARTRGRCCCVDPSEHHSALEVWTWAFMICDLMEVADFVVEDDHRGVPVALHAIFPEFGHLEPFPRLAGGVAGYVFWRADGERIHLEPRDIVGRRRTHPSARFARSVCLGAGVATRQGPCTPTSTSATAQGRTLPSFYVASDQDLNRTLRRALRDRTEAALHGGKWQGKGCARLR